MSITSSVLLTLVYFPITLLSIVIVWKKRDRRLSFIVSRDNQVETIQRVFSTIGKLKVRRRWSDLKMSVWKFDEFLSSVTSLLASCLFLSNFQKCFVQLLQISFPRFPSRSRKETDRVVEPAILLECKPFPFGSVIAKISSTRDRKSPPVRIVHRRMQDRGKASGLPSSGTPIDRITRRAVRLFLYGREAVSGM